MALGDRFDPYAAYNFVVTIQGTDVAGFTEASGLENDFEVIDYRNGNEPNRKRKLVGLASYSDIMLKRGFTASDVFWTWWRETFEGVITRRDLSVTLRNEAQQSVLRWNVAEAWLKKVSGPSFNAASSETAIESCELCHEGCTLEVLQSGSR